ncbi:MAG: serine hydrolase [Balneolaceae bacterium]
MKRLALFIGVFLTVTVFVFGSIFLFNIEAFSTFFKNRSAMSEGSEWIEKTYSLKGLTEYIRENPQHVSVASLVINKPDSVIYYGEETPRPMGSISNFFIIAGYLNAFENNVIDPDSEFEWDLASQHLLPKVYESAHSESKNRAVKEKRLVNGKISYRNALDILAKDNSPALSDYLWFKLGYEYWANFMKDLDLVNTDNPLPFSGLYLAAAPNIREMSFNEIMNHWNSLTRDEKELLVIQFADNYATNENIRRTYLEKLNNNRLGNTFKQERDALTMFPKTTAKEMVLILEKLWHDSFLSEQTSRELKKIIQWPGDEQTIKLHYNVYGAIYDNRMGLLNGIDFGTSLYTGDTTVQAVFFDRLPISFWFHMSSNHMHQDFQQRLIYDPALIELMQKVSSNTHE